MPSNSTGSRRSTGLLALVLLLLSCTTGELGPVGTSSLPDEPVNVTERTEVNDNDSPVAGATNALVADVDVVVTDSGEALLTVKPGMQRYVQICPEGECSADITYLLRPLLLIDFSEVVVIDPFQATIANEPGILKWWEFPVRLDLGPGQHCVVTIHQWSPQAGLPETALDGVNGRSDLIGAGETPDACNTDGLVTFDGEFRPTDRADCSSLPLLSGVSNGVRARDDEMFVSVPACPYEQVLVQLRAGELALDLLERIPPAEKAGLYVAVRPRPIEGTHRLLTVRVDWQAGPDGSGLVVSPPLEFPIDSG